MNKSTSKAVWVLVVFIILVTTIVLVRISNDSDNAQEQATANALATQDQNNRAFTDCMKEADNEYIDAQVSYCEYLGNSQNTCIFLQSLPNLSLGKAGDNKRAEEQMCYNQYPGAIYNQNE